MAKKRAGTTTLVGFAQDLGKLLGTTERKATEWMGQREALAKNLAAIRDKADQLLRELTGGAADMAVAVGLSRGTRRGRPPGSKNRKKRTLSAKARKAISDAQKKRWAAQKAMTGKRTTKKAAGGDSVGNG